MIMKKSGLLMAMAALVSVPTMADTAATVYGSLRMYTSAGDSRDLDISNDLSRLGVKGSFATDLDNVEAFYQIEAFVGNDNGTDPSATQNEGSFGLDGRLAYVGLKGDFGQVTAGQQWVTLYNMVTGVADMAYSISAETQYYFRKDSSFAWVSPEYSGFQAAASVFADADVDTGEDTDHYQLAVKYNTGAVTLAAGLDRASAQSEPDVQAVSIHYSADALTLVALVQRAKTDLAHSEAVFPYELCASYAWGNQTLILTHYDADDAVDTNGYNLELHSSLGKSTTLYSNLQSDEVDGESDLAYGVGLRLDF
jgi:hypothetical protein